MISLPNPRTMNYYKVTNIELDFDGEDLTQDEQNDIIQEATNCLWTSPTEEDLNQTIANNIGYGINSFSYDVVPA